MGHFDKMKEVALASCKPYLVQLHSTFPRVEWAFNILNEDYGLRDLVRAAIPALDGLLVAELIAERPEILDAESFNGYVEGEHSVRTYVTASVGMIVHRELEPELLAAAEAAGFLARDVEPPEEAGPKF